MRLKCFNRLGVIFLAAMSALAASGQTTYIFTTTGLGYNINGSGPNPTINTMHGGTGYTLQISTSDPLFLTTNLAIPRTSSQNYYAVNPGAFSNTEMAIPTNSATVVFTPPASATDYNVYYVDAISAAYGVLDIQSTVTFPDTTSTISISRGIVPTNGPATVTIIAKNSGNTISTVSSAFTVSVSSGGGSVSSLSPSSGSSFTATYTAGTTAGAYSVSDGLGASVPVSVVKSVPLKSFTMTNVAGTQLDLTAKGYSNLTFQVMMSKNLFAWTNLGPATSSVTGLLQFTDTNAPFTPQRFYRLAYP